MNCSEFKERIRTTKLINGETVAYTICTSFSVFILICIKQILKTFFSVSAPVAVLAAFIIAQVVSFLLEKRFVFRKSILSSELKQIFMFLFRAAVNFGFYKLAEFGFGDILSMQTSFVWLVAISISFFFNYYFDRLILFDCNYEAKEIKYSKIYLRFFVNRFVIASAGLTAVCITIIYLIYTVFPFGDSTVMRMDLYHQYGPLFAELYDRVVNHQSFLYSWTSGGGSSFLGNYFNYLASPLSAVIFLFDKEDISFAISFLVSLKCILSSVTFSLYLKKSLDKHNYITASFGVMYAFSAYFLAYYWNVMWLDGMILLPVIALGIERIINEGKIKTYVISLVLLFYSTYYMGFMTCIFAVVYFLGYYIINMKPGEVINPDASFKKKYSFRALYNNKFFNRGVKFAAGSIAAAGMCAAVLVPVFFILRSCSATSDSFPSTFESYFNIFDFLTSHLAGLETTIRSSGNDVLPNVYSGMLAVILIPLFVINKDIRLREKAVYIIMLLFFLVSFNNNCFNFIWHAFHFPNDLPFRFSYMYSFLLLTAGFKCIDKFKSISIKDICYVGMAWVFFICVAQKMSTEKMLESTIYISIAFIIIWCGFLYIYRKGKFDKLVIGVTALVIVFSEVLISDTASILITQDNSDYKANYKQYSEAISKIREEDDGFYREELCYLDTRMDPSYYGYNGMSVFSSMAYENYSRLQYSLGMFGNRINSYTYNTQTPVYNMMFAIKYLMHYDTGSVPSDHLFNYKFTTENGNTDVYENKYFLPISYCVSNNIDKWDTEEGNPFDLQNDFFALSTGYNDVFKEVEYTDTAFDGMLGDKVNGNGTYWFSKEDDDSQYGYVDITFTPVKDGNIYLYVTSPDIKNLEVNCADTGTLTQSIDEPYILDLGYVTAGEELTLSLDCGGIDTLETYAEIYAYSVDEDILSAGWRKLNNSSLQITSFNNTKIEGTVSAEEDSYLYSSIPFDKGWKVLIDGEEAETFETGNALLTTVIKAGEHTVTYSYTPRGLYIGIIISAASIAGICGYIAYTVKKKNEMNDESVSSY